MGLPEFVFGVIILLVIAGITVIAQPPNRWVEWFRATKEVA